MFMAFDQFIHFQIILKESSEMWAHLIISQHCSQYMEVPQNVNRTAFPKLPDRHACTYLIFNVARVSFLSLLCQHLKALFLQTTGICLAVVKICLCSSVDTMNSFVKFFH